MPLIKSSEILENKGFFAVCSSAAVIGFHMVLPLPSEPHKGKSKGGKIW